MKIYKYTIITFLIINFSIIAVKAQTNFPPSIYHNPLLQAPNVATLGKFGDIPVGKYTGIPEINIPLYTIKAKDFELPISISYHAGGIGVGEEASYIGLGWALYAGGMISQMVNGGNDLADVGDVMYNYKDIEMPEAGEDGATYTNYIGGNTELDYPTVEITEASYLYYRRNNSDVQEQAEIGYENDYEPDMFCYNFGTYSGKFFWHKATNAFQTLDRSKIKIDYKGVNVGWTLTTPDGFIYKFNAKEPYRTRSCSVGQNGTCLSKPNFNNYYLSVILMPTGDSIQFIYNTGDEIYNIAQLSESSSKADPAWPARGIYHQPNFAYDARQMSMSQYTPQYLSKIIFPAGYVQFNWDTRIDIINGKRLTNIKIYNYNNVLIKTIDFFNNTYFQGIQSNSDGAFDLGLSQIDPGITFPINDDLKLKRLRLDSIRISDQQNAYQFFYDNTPLPSKTSFSRDYWGFYNGKYNKTFLPNLLYYDQAGLPDYSNLGGDYTDRRATDFTKACVLNKIVYPTKGYTEFQYELNSFSNYHIPNDKGATYSGISYGGGLRAHCVIDNDGKGNTIKKTYKYEYTSNGLTYSYGKIMDLPKFCRAFRLFEWYRASINDGFYNCTDAFGCCDFPTGYQIVLYGDPANGLSTTSQGNYVGYDKVIEIYGDETINMGQVEYTYWNEEFYTNRESIAPGIAQPTNGDLTDVTYKDTGGNITKEETYNYDGEVDIIKAYGIKFEDISFGDVHYSYNMHEYPIRGSRPILKSKTTKIKDNTNNVFITTTTTFEYDLSNGLPSSETIVNSDGSTTKKTYTYSSDYYWPNAIYDNRSYVFSQMVNRNIINTPIEITTLKDNKVIGSDLILYKLSGNLIVPDIKYNLQIQNPLDLPLLGLTSTYSNYIAPNFNVYFQMNSFYKPVLYFQQYDNLGNILQLQKTNDIPTSYIWGYNNTYPVAKIVGADYNTVKTALGGDAGIANLQTKTNDADIIGLLAPLRTIPNVFVTTYLYSPLVGITSETDANGQTIKYEYDNFGRLLRTRDIKGNIVKQYDYHYNGQ